MGGKKKTPRAKSRSARENKGGAETNSNQNENQTAKNTTIIVAIIGALSVIIAAIITSLPDYISMNNPDPSSPAIEMPVNSDNGDISEEELPATEATSEEPQPEVNVDDNPGNDEDSEEDATEKAQELVNQTTDQNLSDGLKGHFNSLVNRADVAVEIFNGHKSVGYSISSYQENPFSDVKYSMSSYQPILWAVHNGIMSGYENGKFGPDDTITREQFCAILVNHAQLIGFTLPQKKNAVTFTDNDKISSWAINAVTACQCAGIIQGYENGSFKPQEGIRRNELIQMLYRYFDALPE